MQKQSPNLTVVGRLASIDAQLDSEKTPRSTPRPEDRVFDLRGADGKTIAPGLVSPKFAVSRALFWSRTIGEPVDVFEIVSDGEILDASVNATDMSDAEFEQLRFDCAVDRLKVASDILKERAMEIVAMRQDVEQAITAVASVEPQLPNKAKLADLVEQIAARAEQAEWTVLVDGESEADMLGEYSA